MFKNIGWTLGNDCPCNCKHCYSMQVREKGANLTKEIVDRVISEILSIGAETVNFGGNEPLFTNGIKAEDSLLPYIIKKSVSNNLAVGITSAGPSIILLEKYYNDEFKMLNDIDISIDSPIEEEHNKNRGANVFKLALKSLELCQKYNISHTIVMCAMKWNFTKDRVEKLVQLSKKYGANIRINMLKPTTEKQYKMMPSKDQIIECYNYLIENCYTVDMSDPILAGKFSNDIVSGCSCGINSLRINSITPDGKISVSPCVYMHHYQVGNLLEDSLKDIVQSEQFKEFKYRKNNYKKINGCQDCEKLEVCRGGCTAASYWNNFFKTGKKDILAKDPYCIIDNCDFIKPDFIKSENLVHENYLCTWIGKAK